jgi:pseudaminic acid synthase
MNFNNYIQKRKYPFIIAEISANHNQKFNIAKKIIDNLSKTKVDAIKFQTFKPDGMTLKINKKDFLIKEKNNLWRNSYLFDLYKKSSMPWSWQKKLFVYARKKGLIPFSSPFHEEAVDFLESIACPIYKIASLENNHYPLIRKIISTKKPIIISTGATSYNEICEIVNFLKKNNCKNYSLLKCTSVYPADYQDLNLNTIPQLIKKFKCNVGFSDHTKDDLAAQVAVSLGAKIIEKHVKLDKKIKTLDSKFSLTVNELDNYIKKIRHVIDIHGNKKKFFNSSEKFAKSRKRSIYISKDIKENEVFTIENIKVVRPAKGLHSKHFDKVLGKKSKKNLIKGTPLKIHYIKN